MTAAASLPAAGVIVEQRERLAELRLLERFDRIRLSLGYDFGNGRRANELSRRRLELDATVALLAGPLEPAELAAAYNRIGRLRHERAHRDALCYGTPGCRRTREAWRRLHVGLAVELAELDRAKR